VKNIAAYLGCAGILIGGVGLAYEVLAPAADPARDAAAVEAAPSPASAEWPPANAAVAFHDEMIELLSPPKTQATQTQTAAPEPQHGAPQPTTTGQAQQQAAPEREVVRDLAPDRRQQRRTSRRSQQPQPATPDDVIAADGDPVTVGRGGSRSTRDRNRDAFVIGRDGRRYRIDRADRAQATEAEELPADTRRYRIEREPPVERREPGFMPDPFRIFGPSSGGW
jgi:hypothetical protein